MNPALLGPCNESIFVRVDGELVLRKHATVSVFDSSVQCGDAVREALRTIARLHERLVAEWRAMH
jgi:hypothetical protein